MSSKAQTQQHNRSLLLGTKERLLMSLILEPHCSFALRLPTSLREKASLCAQDAGISLNQFIIVAVTEKIARMGMDISED
jgi:HicB family